VPAEEAVGTDAPAAIGTAEPEQPVDSLGMVGPGPEEHEPHGADVAGAEEKPPDVVTPIPETPPEGLPAGTPVLVGGADLQDATATLISYRDPEGAGPREVLLATLTEDAEAKLLDALAVSTEQLVPVQVTEEVTGRLPLDQDKQLFEQVAKAAKSVNHKIGTGAAVPEHTKGYVLTAAAAVQQVLSDPAATADEHAMAQHYKVCLDAVAAKITALETGEAGAKDKLPFAVPYEHTGTATVTKMVPAAPQETPPGLLPAAERKASRIHAEIDTDTGLTSWDGTSRKAANGTEYAIDLGQGWSAVYRPYAANEPESTSSPCAASSRSTPRRGPATGRNSSAGSATSTSSPAP
jgi:hypothetical protein